MMTYVFENARFDMAKDCPISKVKPNRTNGPKYLRSSIIAQQISPFRTVLSCCMKMIGDRMTAKPTSS